MNDLVLTILLELKSERNAKQNGTKRATLHEKYTNREVRVETGDELVEPWVLWRDLSR